MAYTKTQIFGGSFQDASGATLSNGWLLMVLSHDSNVTLPASQVVAGVPIRINLDNLGNVAGTQTIWTDDLLNPSKSFYTVDALNSAGLRVWAAPQYWTLTSGSPIDLGIITPTNP